MQFLDANSSNTLVVSKPPLLALLTNIGSQQTRAVRWNVTHPVFKGRQQLVDVLTCRTFLAGDNGGVSIQSDEGMPKVWMCRGDDATVTLIWLIATSASTVVWTGTHASDIARRYKLVSVECERRK